MGIVAFSASVLVFSIVCLPLLGGCAQGDVAEQAKLGTSVQAEVGHVQTMADRFVSAIFDKEIEQVQLLIAQGADVNAVTRDGLWTPLKAAVDRGDPALVQMLLKAGADVSCVSSVAGDRPVLFDAARGFCESKDGDSTIFQMLLNAGADINARSGLEGTVLIQAIEQGADPQRIKYILAAGADPAIANGVGWTPVMVAVHKNAKPAVFEVLESAGVDLFASMEDGKTLLHYAVESYAFPTDEPQPANLELIVWLLQRGFGLEARDNSGKTALMVAARGNPDAAVVRFLLEAGADISARDNFEWTALMHAACWNANAEVVSALIEGGAAADVVTYQGLTPAIVAMTNENDSRTEIFRLLRQKGASLQMANEEAFTPLHLAAVIDAQIVQDLLAEGMNADSRDKTGLTPLMYGVRGERPVAVARVLIAAGADVNARDDNGRTAVMFVREDTLDALNLLLAAGASPTDVDKDGNSLLHHLARGSTCVEAIKKVVSLGADVNRSNAAGQTPLMVALESYGGYPELISVLLCAGADRSAKDIEGRGLEYCLKKGDGRRFSGLNDSMRAALANESIPAAQADAAGRVGH